MWKRIKPAVVGLVVVVVLGVAAVALKPGFLQRHHAPVAARPTPDTTFIGEGERAPREFVYLDLTRAAAYLSQLENGIKKLQTISDSQSAKVNAELGIGTAKLGGEASQESAVETSVSPTASSSFQALISRLNELGLYKHLDTRYRDTLGDAQRNTVRSGCRRGVLPTDLSVFARNWCDVYESAMVTFVARLHKPEFVQAYLKLRWAEANGRLRKAGRALLKLIGDQPRVPIVTSKHGLRLIMPVQTALLSAEPTLFSPPLRVVAKVVRRVDKTPYDGLGFYTRFDRLTWHRFAAVRERLGINTKRLRAELREYRSVKPPAALLLPVAIFN
jgi:hypothetical protein